MSKLASKSSEFDISLTDAEKVVASKNRMIAKPKHSTQYGTQNTSSNAKESFIGTSLLAQETDTRIQFQSNYTFYIVWFVIAAVLVVIMFSNFFYTSPSSQSDFGYSGSSGDGDETGSSSSNVLGFGIIAMLIFIYFIIQFALSRFNISRPRLPFESINPLFVFKSNS